LHWYEHDPDPGIHGAAAWALRQWGQQDALAQIDRRLAAAWSAGERGPRRRGWFVNSQGQTLAVVPGPLEFAMGSPPEEYHRNRDELWHRRRIGWTFAVGTTEVTLAQFHRFKSSFGNRLNLERLPPDTAAFTVDWYEAAAYCNWLSKQDGLADDQLCYLPN